MAVHLSVYSGPLQNIQKGTPLGHHTWKLWYIFSFCKKIFWIKDIVFFFIWYSSNSRRDIDWNSIFLSKQSTLLAILFQKVD
tara:strand:+ start:1333 stop:1578 length:246 start_codon:yes stop_codon:yes gene_type:complete